MADLAFARALGVSQSTAAGLALLLTGWVYFPARQWLIARVTQQRDVELLHLFPRTVKVVLESRTEEELARGWRSLLREMFDPLEVTDADVPVPAAAIAEEGMALLVPSVASQPPTRLRLARRGHRLFTVRERDTVQSLVDLFEHVLRQRNAYELGVRAERRRIARDLHDDIGSRLLTLVHRSTDGPVADLARDTLRELRTVISTLGSGPAPLAEALADWRSEAAERCDAAGIELGWTQPEHLDGVQLDSPTRTNILRVLREALSNALRHARPTRVDVDVRLDGSVLSLTMSDDGSAPPPSSWPRGRGLVNIEQRVAELGGRSELRQRTTRGTELVFRVPLPEGANR